MENLTHEKIIETWKKVFPNSLMEVKKACLTENCFFFTGYLAKDDTELQGGYRLNSHLGYCFEIENGIYKEHDFYVLIKPDNKYMAYGRAKGRKISIKDITVEKLEKRFLKVKALIVENKDNFINLKFDINDKI